MRDERRPSDPDASPSAVEVVGEARPRELDRAVSVIVPAYNEEGHVAEQVHLLRDELEASDWRFELIVVDDGSDDGTAAAAAAAGARVLRHTENRGYGAALKEGIAAARYDWILIIDADGTYPTEAVPAILAASDGRDMVVGARTGADVAVPLSRRPAKWFLRRLASYLSGRRLPDLNSGLRLMKRSLVERYRHLLPDGFSFTTTITLAATCNGHPVEYVSIDYRRRKGRSKLRPHHALDFWLLILRTIVFFNPLKVFLPAGAALALAGVAKFVYDVVIGDLSESAVLAFLGAMIIWAVGLLADQNARIAMSGR